MKVKMATESGKTTQAQPSKDLTGKQGRQGEKLYLLLMGEPRVTARCSSEMICSDKEEHSSVARIDRQSHTFEWGDGPMQYIVREG